MSSIRKGIGKALKWITSVGSKEDVVQAVHGGGKPVFQVNKPVPQVNKSASQVSESDDVQFIPLRASVPPSRGSVCPSTNPSHHHQSTVFPPMQPKVQMPAFNKPLSRLSGPSASGSSMPSFYELGREEAMVSFATPSFFINPLLSSVQPNIDLRSNQKSAPLPTRTMVPLNNQHFLGREGLQSSRNTFPTKLSLKTKFNKPAFSQYKRGAKKNNSRPSLSELQKEWARLLKSSGANSSSKNSTPFSVSPTASSSNLKPSSKEQVPKSGKRPSLSELQKEWSNLMSSGAVPSFDNVCSPGKNGSKEVAREVETSPGVAKLSSINIGQALQRELYSTLVAKFEETHDKDHRTNSLGCLREACSLPDSSNNFSLSNAEDGVKSETI